MPPSQACATTLAGEELAWRTTSQSSCMSPISWLGCSTCSTPGLAGLADAMAGLNSDGVDKSVLCAFPEFRAVLTGSAPSGSWMIHAYRHSRPACRLSPIATRSPIVPCLRQPRPFRLGVRLVRGTRGKQAKVRSAALALNSSEMLVGSSS